MYEGWFLKQFSGSSTSAMLLNRPGGPRRLFLFLILPHLGRVVLPSAYRGQIPKQTLQDDLKWVGTSSLRLFQKRPRASLALRAFLKDKKLLAGPLKPRYPGLKVITMSLSAKVHSKGSTEPRNKLNAAQLVLPSSRRLLQCNNQSPRYPINFLRDLCGWSL